MKYAIRFESSSALPNSAEKAIHETLVAALGRIENFELGRSITYARQPDWWAANMPTGKGTNNFDRVRIEYFRDSTVAMEAFKAGQIDLRSENISKNWATAYDFPAVASGLVIKRDFSHHLPTGMQGYAMNTRRPVFANPLVRKAMAETFDSLNLYVLNQGTSTVTDLSPTDLSTMATIPVGNSPAWVTVRPDNQRVYVVTQGDGQLYTIRTDTNAVIAGSPQSVGGAGANFVLYDKTHNRLYVTNPNAGTVYVFDATSDPPTPMATLTVPAPPITAPVSTVCATATCTYSAVMPVSVAALPDGTRFYVASYVTGTATSGASSTCPDSNVSALAGCIIPQITVYDAGTLLVKTTVFPLLPPVTTASATTIYPFALAPAAFCAPVFPYSPASARFRMSAAASPDSTRVYASMCDGGAVAVVTTNTNTIATGGNSADTLVNDLVAPFSAASAPPNGEPPPQNPVLLLTGP